MRRIFELPDRTHETIQAQGDYLRALRLLRGLANDRYPASYDILAYVLQAVGRFIEAEEAYGKASLQQLTSKHTYT
jgi:tetratricopeptide (TPR) repeat protein